MMKQIDKFCCCIFSLFLMMACQEEEIMDKTAGFQVSLQDMGVIPARRYLLRPVLIRYLLPMEIIRF